MKRITPTLFALFVCARELAKTRTPAQKSGTNHLNTIGIKAVFGTLTCFVFFFATTLRGADPIPKSNVSTVDPVFTDVTAAEGLNATGFTFGVPVWGDFDNDGDLDVFVDNHYKAPPYLYLNNGNGTFRNIFSTSGIGAKGDRKGAGWIDFDNDGDLDLSFIKGASGGTRLGIKKDEFYLNQGNDAFTNIATSAGVTNTNGRGRGVAFADHNNDGLVDMLVGNVLTNLVLYKNKGDGTFVDVTAAAGLTGLRYPNCAFADYNNDGFPDICCTSYSYTKPLLRDVLLKNNGDGTFTDVSAQAHIQPLTQGRSIACGDYDNDGDLDLFISRGTSQGAKKQTLYRNNGDGTFTDVTDQAGLGVVMNARAAVWGDYNNDGYLDLYLVDSGSDPVGKGSNHLYRNNQDGTFTDVAAEAGVAVLVPSRGRGASWGDYDNDGFLDLFVTNGEDKSQFPEGPQILYHNEGNGNGWVKLKLIGTTSNRQGLGAKITVQIGRAIEYRELNGASGHFFCQEAEPVHFGIGNAAIVDRITVKWPSGIIQSLINVSANQELTVVEGQ